MRRTTAKAQKADYILQKLNKSSLDVEVEGLGSTTGQVTVTDTGLGALGRRQREASTVLERVGASALVSELSSGHGEALVGAVADALGRGHGGRGGKGSGLGTSGGALGDAGGGRGGPTGRKSDRLDGEV